LAVAQSDKRRGVASFLLDNFEGICLDKGINWLRADTHKDNLPMQGLLNKHGFKRVGVIYLENGAQRIAFEKRVA
jgi:ribosomal protein S18 acetylase RimI-like enzyme